MNSKTASKNDPQLVVVCGNTPRKAFAIDKCSMVLGRAVGCDIELDSKDVCFVHCVLTNTAKGLRIRDCASRTGTKVNGERIRGEVELRDTDIILIGSFSFELQLPPQAPTPAAPVADHGNLAEQERRIKHLERSRERMAEMALAMRRRLLAERQTHHNRPLSSSSLDTPSATPHPRAHSLAMQKADLEQRESHLRDQVHEFEAVQVHFDKDRRELANLKANLEQKERDLEQQQARLQTEQQKRDRATTGERRPRVATMHDLSTMHDISLDHSAIRQTELNNLARHLQNLQQQLRSQEESVRQHHEELQHSWEEVRQAQDWLSAERRDLASMRAKLEKERAAGADRSTLAAQLDNLAQMYADARRRQDEELEALRRLRDQLQSTGGEAPIAARGKLLTPLTASAKVLSRPVQTQRDSARRAGRLTDRVGHLIEQLRASGRLKG